jgi:predicted phage terminase large subunit-like protein
MSDRTALLRAILRADLNAFAHRVFQTVAPNDPYLDNWHIEAITHRLERCRSGETTRLMISLPPRSGKSIITSVAFVAWLLGHNPSAKIVCASYSKDLASKHSRDCRTVLQSPWYREAFPGTRINPEKSAEDNFMTSKRGYRMATSIGATLTGLGGNYLIVDDPLKPEDAYSETARQRVNDWSTGTLLTRLNDKEKGVIIVVQQRLHEADLVGHHLAMNPEVWDYLKLPAIAEANETIPLGNGRLHHRRESDVLHPERESRARLDEMRAAMGSAAFSAQYQQSPLPADGGHIKRSWFSIYEAHQRPPRFDRIVQSWDTAAKATELSDYSVCVTCGVTGHHIYLLHVFRKQLNFPDLKRTVRELANAHHANEILIEDKSSGIQLIQELRNEGLEKIKPCNPLNNKFMRLMSQTPTIESGFVYLPKEAPWLDTFLHELMIFPNGKHDDQVDAFSQALEWIQTERVPGQGFLDWIALQMAKGS